MLKILIIEDEPIAARRLQKMVIESIDREAEFTSLDSIEGVLEWKDEGNTADIVLLDINLADGSSFEIFNYHTFDESSIIFTTAYDEFAIKAFKVNAVDYLLKPVILEELKSALLKAIQKNGVKVKETDLVKKQTFPQRLMVRIGNKYKVVEYEEIAYFYTRDKINFVCTRDERRIPVDFTLDALEGMLDKSVFFRLNRQTITHLNAIAQILPHTKSRLRISLQPNLEAETVISWDKVSGFKEWYKSS